MDQICINQANSDKKGHQVNLMADIYARASNVEAWLGPAFAGSDEAMDVIARISKIESHGGHKYGDEANIPTSDKQDLDRYRLAISKIMSVPYWSRT
jgi:hypothetical protein